MKDMKSILIYYVAFVFISCTSTGPESLQQNTYYRDEMRAFVQEISQYAKSIDPEFLIVPQNGQELFTVDGEPDGLLSSTYLEAIDGTGREDLFYGYSGDDIPTPPSENIWMTAFLDTGENAGVEALVTDYCSTQSYIDDSYFQNETRGYISFAADHRELDNIPAYPAEPYNQNNEDISRLQDAQNFLYLINPEQFSDVQAFMNELQSANFDILIIDLFFGDTQLPFSDITSLETKISGGDRQALIFHQVS